MHIADGCDLCSVCATEAMGYVDAGDEPRRMIDDYEYTPA